MSTNSQTLSQDTPPSDSQPILAAPLAAEPVKPRKSNKPPHVKAQVIAKRYIENKPISQIAKDLEISRPTVYAILDEANLDKQLESGRALSARLIPKAIDVIDFRLGLNSENAAIKVLENTIWPLNAKQGKPNDPSLVLAIQNLMGNVQVNAPALKEQAVESRPDKQLSDTAGGK